MNNFEYFSPTKIYFGKDRENEIGNILNSYNISRVLLCYGMGSIKKNGLYDRVIDSLNKSNICWCELSGVEANPKVSSVRKGLEIARLNKVELVLAIGGGSAIDCAKAIANSFYLKCDPWCLNDGSVKPTKALFIASILTISAAGSELSNSCVITNEETKVKNGYNTDLNRPLFTIMNPELTYSVSKFQTGCGVVDIFMHTIERYLNEVDNNYFEEEVALGLLKSVLKAGKIAIENPNDYDARSALMVASSFSHNGLTGVGGNFYFTVHRLEHQLSGIRDEVAHGAGLSIIFPAWAKYTYKSLPKKFAYFAENVLNIKGNDDEETALLGINWIENFFSSIGMPIRLSYYNITDKEIEYMASRITCNDTTKVNGFVKLGYQDVVNIFNLAK